MTLLLFIYIISVLGNVVILCLCKKSKVHSERFQIKGKQDAEGYFICGVFPVLNTICLVLALLMYACAFLTDFEH